MKVTNVLLAILASSLFFTSCENDDTVIEEQKEEPIEKTNAYQEGIIISHEGGSSVSGSTSYVSYDLTSVQNGIFDIVNGEQPGSFQQSIGFNGEDAYIVTDNLNKVTRVNRYTFEKQNEITTDLVLPRYIVFSNDKAYVSNWGDTGVDTDDFIAVVDLDTQEVETTISVGLGPEQLAIVNGKLYVSHKGAWGINNIVSVIDLSTNEVVKEIETGYKPDELLIIEDELWVEVEGGQSWNSTGETTSSIAVINTIDDTVTKTLELGTGIHISEFDYDNGKIYYSIGANVYELEIDSEVLSTEALASTSSIYGLSVEDGKIYTTDAGDFASNGFLNVYDIDTGAWLPTVTVGLAPSKIYFNYNVESELD